MNKIVLLTHFVSSGSLPLPPLSSYRGGSPLLSCLFRLLLPLLGRVFFGLADRSDNWLRSQARFLCGGCEGERERGGEWSLSFRGKGNFGGERFFCLLFLLLYPSSFLIVECIEDDALPVPIPRRLSITAVQTILYAPKTFTLEWKKTTTFIPFSPEDNSCLNHLPVPSPILHSSFSPTCV